MKRGLRIGARKGGAVTPSHRGVGKAEFLLRMARAKRSINGVYLPVFAAEPRRLRCQLLEQSVLPQDRMLIESIYM